jgi:hypothetical protein
MICVRCKCSVIGNIPSNLYSTQTCKKCYPIHMAEQPSDEEKAEIEQKKKKQKYKKAEEARIEAERIAEDERIDNRFDILDM